MKTAALKIDDWRVKIFSESEEYLDLLQFYLPNHFSQSGAGSETIRFKVFVRKRNFFKNKSRRFLNTYKTIGLAAEIDHAQKEAIVGIDPARKITTGILYHCGFLFPLSSLLLPRYAALIHGAAVVEKRGTTLILGSSGAGKSTFASAFYFAGALSLTDEHSLIHYKMGKMVAGWFTSRIGLSPRAMKNFGRHRHFIWNPSVEKFILKSSERAFPAQSFEIKKIIFPIYSKTGKFRAKKLLPAEVFKRLLRDDYYYHSALHLQSFGQNHVELFMKLCNSAKGYAVHYTATDIPHLARKIRKL